VENLTYAHPQTTVNPVFMRVSADEAVKEMWIYVDKCNILVGNRSGSGTGQISRLG